MALVLGARVDKDKRVALVAGERVALDDLRRGRDERLQQRVDAVLALLLLRLLLLDAKMRGRRAHERVDLAVVHQLVVRPRLAVGQLLCRLVCRLYTFISKSGGLTK